MEEIDVGLQCGACAGNPGVWFCVFWNRGACAEKSVRVAREPSGMLSKINRVGR